MNGLYEPREILLELDQLCSHRNRASAARSGAPTHRHTGSHERSGLGAQRWIGGHEIAQGGLTRERAPNERTHDGVRFTERHSRLHEPLGKVGGRCGFGVGGGLLRLVLRRLDERFGFEGTPVRVTE